MRLPGLRLQRLKATVPCASSQGTTEGLRPSRKLRYFRSPSLKNIHGKKNELV